MGRIEECRQSGELLHYGFVVMVIQSSGARHTEAWVCSSSRRMILRMRYLIMLWALSGLIMVSLSSPSPVSPRVALSWLSVLRFLYSSRSEAHLFAVLVVGHTGCGGCIAAWGAPPPTHAPHAQDHPLSRFLDPVVRLKHIMPPGTGVDDLIKENVKANVRNVIASDVSGCSTCLQTLTWSR
jgi:hypothetical protein